MVVYLLGMFRCDSSLCWAVTFIILIINIKTCDICDIKWLMTPHYPSIYLATALLNAASVCLSSASWAAIFVARGRRVLVKEGAVATRAPAVAIFPFSRLLGEGFNAASSSSSSPLSSSSWSLKFSESELLRSAFRPRVRFRLVFEVFRGRGGGRLAVLARRDLESLTFNEGVLLLEGSLGVEMLEGRVILIAVHLQHHDVDHR